MKDPDYFFNVASPAFAAQIMRMAENSIAEIVGETDGAFLQKFIPESYALARKTGLVDLEITCVGGTSIVGEIQQALYEIADEKGIDEIMVRKKGMKIAHLYFYPKENE